MLHGAMSRAAWRVSVKFRTMPLFLKLFMLVLIPAWIWSVIEIHKENERNARITEWIVAAHRRAINQHTQR